MVFLTIPFIAFMLAMYSVAVFGEFIKKDGMITQEYIACLILVSAIAVYYKIRKK